MTKKDFEKTEKALARKIKELEEKETVLENRLFDIEFSERKKAISERNRKPETVLIKKTVSEKELGKNSLGIPYSTDRDSIRPIDSYPDNYYSESLSGNKRIIKFFAENPGKFFSAKEVERAIGSKRFNSTSARSYFVKRKGSIKVKVSENGSETFSGRFFKEIV